MRISIPWTLALVVSASPVAADIIDAFDIGEGFNTSTVQIDFGNGNGYLFDVHWNDPGTTGWDLLMAIAEESEDVSLDYSVSEWGVFLQGIDVLDDSDWGVGAGWPEVEDYWHYWQRESSADPWEFSTMGADVRLVSEGSGDGLVFLSAGEPQSVPAPGVLGLLCLGGFLGNRRAR